MFMYYLAFNWHFGFASDFTPMSPGLEMKYACEAASDSDTKLSFMGQELNKKSIDMCYHETRFNIPQYISTLFKMSGTNWYTEV